jgi:hypothetical protein
VHNGWIGETFRASFTADSWLPCRQKSLNLFGAATCASVSDSIVMCRTDMDHSTSRARIIAGLSGFLIFSQSRDGSDR